MTWISIVTIVRNNPIGLEKTIRSIISQSHRDFEFIIVDGHSTDNTMEIVNKYSEKVDQIISEPDKGIYDAMNKGAMLAAGKYINFMNAGDTFYSLNVLDNVQKQLDTNADIYFGDAYFEGSGEDKKEILWPAERNSDNFWKRMPFSHQSMFIKKEVLKNNLFSLRWKIVSDFEFIIKQKKQKRILQYVNCPIVLIERGGISHNKLFLRTWERFMVIMKLDFSLLKFIYYIKFLLKIVFKKNG